MTRERLTLPVPRVQNIYISVIFEESWVCCRVSCVAFGATLLFAPFVGLPCSDAVKEAKPAKLWGVVVSTLGRQASPKILQVEYRMLILSSSL